jgi:hypothetical protein
VGRAVFSEYFGFFSVSIALLDVCAELRTGEEEYGDPRGLEEEQNRGVTTYVAEREGGAATEVLGKRFGYIDTEEIGVRRTIRCNNKDVNMCD